MASRQIVPAFAPPPGSTTLARGSVVTAALMAAGSGLLVFAWDSVLPVLFALLLALPVVFVLTLRRGQSAAVLRIFLRSFATGMLAAGIAAYYAVVLLDPFQLGSDAWSFYELSSQAGPARTLQDLQTITEGAGAVVLWTWVYDAAAVLGFPREPYIGISVNVVLVALSALLTARAAQRLYGEDEYRLERLALFFTISGNMYLFAGLHIRDSSILLVIAILSYGWISYLAKLEHRRLAFAIAATLLAMPLLEILRREFFYVPLLVGFIALVCLNFSRGRGDHRFITLVSLLFGATLAVIAVAAFGEQILSLFQTGQEGYTDLSIAEARSGSLGTALIVEQATLVRIALGVPYLYYFPIPVWAGLFDTTAILLFKSWNALTFYFISGFVFAGGYMILADRRLRSPAFLFALAVPAAFSASIALTSLESRHIGVFLPLFFLVGLMPDARDLQQRRLLRFLLALVLIGMVFVHLTWSVLRYA
ncbi:hypothetical protein [Qipengyuania sediminis]|uniref:hypothetical protein n=1 Tax=Qipengyuania sediminis TaxID=1532023 RepID=UPI00105A9129|nr:hypothetical protein [Qipengyuania sediminis]